jgi:pimeloyl-ACP methyl ester carboxylesterase
MTNTPVVFIHGLWLHADSWQPWMTLFAEAGYAPVAPGWPGDAATVEASRADPESIANQGIDDVVATMIAAIEELPEPPILIGHSFGGMIVEKLLGLNYGVAGIGIDAAQIKGVLPLPLSALHATLPVFKNPANLHRAVSLTADEFAFSFGNALPREESDALFDQWAIPAPGKPLFEAAVANFSLHSPAKVDTGNESRGPLLLIMGGRDHTVPDRGHSLTIDSGWREVADGCLGWLKEQGL